MDRSIKSMKINIETISSKRIEYADIMKALCIIAVIAGHADFANSMIKPWIYSFHMPCFFIVSGMLYSNKKNERVSTFLSKKFRQLMVPYFLWGMMYSSFGFGNLARIVYGSHQSLIQAGSLSSLWFLPAMFLALFGMKVVHKWAKCNSAIEAILGIAIMLIGGVIPPISIGYPWCINEAVMCFGFMLLGHSLRPYADVAFKTPFILIVLVIVGAAGSLLYRLNIPEDLGYVSIASDVYGNVLIFVSTALLGSLMVYAVSSLLAYIGGAKKWLCYIGQNTMVLFLVHKPFIRLFAKVFNIVPVPNCLALFITIVGEVIICFVAKVVIEKYAPVFLGKYESLDGKIK